MSARTSRWLFLATAALLLAYAAFFPLLTVDTVTNMLARAAILEPRNLYLLLFLELSRLLTTLAALAVVVALLARGSERPDARALVLFLLLAVIGYEKVFGSHGYPGPLQEQMATTLLRAGVSQKLLLWVFGPVVWPVWPAAAALLRFSSVFPERLGPESLAASGREDRRGFMRSSTLAGADVGAFFRSLSQTIMLRGAYHPRPLIIASVLLVVLHTLLAGAAAKIAACVALFMVICVAATNLRAAYLASHGEARMRAAWIAEGFVLAIFMFLTSVAVLLLVPTTVARMAAFVLVMLAPAVIIVCLALSVLARGQRDAAGVIDGTVRYGTTLLAVIVTFGVLYLVLGQAARSLGMPRAVGGIVALMLAVLGFGPVKHATDRARLRVLERDELRDAAATTKRRGWG